MRNILKLLVILNLIHLSGCGTVHVDSDLVVENGVKHYKVPEEILDSFNGSKPCCNSFSEVRFTPLAVNTEIDVLMDQASPVYNFDSGKSYFLAYQLPDSKKSFTLTIKSYYQGHAFYPSVLVLDNNYKITRFITTPVFKYAKGDFFERDRVEGTIHFADNSINESYIIVMTTDKLMEQPEYFSEGDGFASVLPGRPVYMPGGRSANHYGPVGSLKIIFASKEIAQQMH